MKSTPSASGKSDRTRTKRGPGFAGKEAGGAVSWQRRETWLYFANERTLHGAAHGPVAQLVEHRTFNAVVAEPAPTLSQSVCFQKIVLWSPPMNTLLSIIEHLGRFTENTKGRKNGRQL